MEVGREAVVNLPPSLEDDPSACRRGSLCSHSVTQHRGKITKGSQENVY